MKKDQKKNVKSRKGKQLKKIRKREIANYNYITK